MFLVTVYLSVYSSKRRIRPYPENFRSVLWYLFVPFDFFSQDAGSHPRFRFSFVVLLAGKPNTRQSVTTPEGQRTLHLSICRLLPVTSVGAGTFNRSFVVHWHVELNEKQSKHLRFFWCLCRQPRRETSKVATMVSHFLSRGPLLNLRWLLLQ